MSTERKEAGHWGGPPGGEEEQWWFEERHREQQQETKSGGQCTQGCSKWAGGFPGIMRLGITETRLV